MTPDEKKAHDAILEKLNNRAWRLQNLYWIEDENGQKVKFRMNWAQRAFYAMLWYLNVVLKARQLGLSTFSLIFMLDKALFEKNQTCGIVDKTDDDAKKKLDRIEFAYLHLDDKDDPATAALGAGIKQRVRIDTANDHEISFTNGSKIWSGVSLRGGTVQFLLVSELGYISFFNPKKALEIKSGALNTVHKGNIVVIESTHEGGKYGVNYDMIVVSQSAPAAPPELTEMDWRFHFFAWHKNPAYVLPLAPGQQLRLSDELVEYFAKLEREHKIKLTDEQKHWYSKKKAVQGDAMWKEFPSTPEEAVNAVVKGAIYGKLVSRLREQKRIVNFESDPSVPIYAFWDIGHSDFTSIWLLQIVGRDICALRYFCRNQEAAPYYMARCAEWEREYGQPIAWHFLPHDAKNKTGLVGKSTVDALIDAGMDKRRYTVVPVTPDVWQGINTLRGLLVRFYIHLKHCGQEWKTADGQRMPSGIACLEGYHTKETDAGAIHEDPVHDASSHGCDSLRTFAEAYAQGLLEGASRLAVGARARPVTVHRGPGPQSYSAGGNPLKRQINVKR